MIQVYLPLVVAQVERNRWLLLIHQLPKEPAYLRVKVGRRLALIGAIALKNSVYVLPCSESTAEDFQWMQQEIVDTGGEATVVEASVVSGISDEALEAKFRAVKDAEYAELASEARTVQHKQAHRRRKRALSADERAELLGEASRLERKLQDLRTTDFFAASGSEKVAGILHELRVQAEAPTTKDKLKTPPPHPTACTWVTRTGVRVDRIASAWLIRRFIDPDAQFKFVAPKGYVPQAGELRFDMPDAEYSHEGDACTFEVLCARFGLNTAALAAIAQIVHEIDVKDGKFARPETAGVAAMIEGIAQQHRDDEKRLCIGGELLGALLSHFANTSR